MGKSISKTKTAFFFLLPAFIFIFVRTVFPLFDAIRLTFSKVKIAPGMPVHSVGLANWVRLVQDPVFWKTIRVTLYFLSIDVGVGFLLAMVIALTLNRDFKGNRVLRVLLIVPWAVPNVAVGLIWQWMYNGNYGIVNGILKQMGIIDKFIVWFGNPQTALPALIFAHMWKIVPFMSLLLLAALQTVPQDLYDAATVDGASKFKQLLYITIPYIKLPMLFTFIFQTIGSIKAFDIVYVCMKGGPMDATRLTYYYAYEQAFLNYNLAYGATIAFTVFAMIFALMLIYIRLFSAEV